MRTEPFDPTLPAYQNDDIAYAFQYNSLENRLNDIQSIVAEYPGENDGHNWYWILLMKDGTYSMAVGGCDYTGWDCQSFADITDGFETPVDAIAAVGKGYVDYDEREYVRQNLLKQITGEAPFALITVAPN